MFLSHSFKISLKIPIRIISTVCVRSPLIPLASCSLVRNCGVMCENLFSILPHMAVMSSASFNNLQVHRAKGTPFRTLLEALPENTVRYTSRDFCIPCTSGCSTWIGCPLLIFKMSSRVNSRPKIYWDAALATKPSPINW